MFYPRDTLLAAIQRQESLPFIQSCGSDGGEASTRKDLTVRVTLHLSHLYSFVNNQNSEQIAIKVDI